MFKALFVLVLLSSGAAADHTQLLVIGDGEERSCRPAPVGWDEAAPYQVAVPDLVRSDLANYFGGRSAQFTPILDAVWHGRVRFCGDDEESLVLNALAILMVRSPGDHVAADDLPGGSEPILVGLASPALYRAIQALEPESDQQSARQVAALAIVRGGLGKAE